MYQIKGLLRGLGAAPGASSAGTIPASEGRDPLDTGTFAGDSRCPGPLGRISLAFPSLKGCQPLQNWVRHEVEAKESYLSVCKRPHGRSLATGDPMCKKPCPWVRERRPKKTAVRTTRLDPDPQEMHRGCFGTWTSLQQGIRNRTEPIRADELLKSPEPKRIEPNRFIPVSCAERPCAWPAPA